MKIHSFFCKTMEYWAIKYSEHQLVELFFIPSITGGHFSRAPEKWGKVAECALSDILFPSFLICRGLSTRNLYDKRAKKEAFKLHFPRSNDTNFTVTVGVVSNSLTNLLRSIVTNLTKHNKRVKIFCTKNNNELMSSSSVFLGNCLAQTSSQIQ